MARQEEWDESPPPPGFWDNVREARRLRRAREQAAGRYRYVDPETGRTVAGELVGPTVYPPAEVVASGRGAARVSGPVVYEADRKHYWHAHPHRDNVVSHHHLGACSAGCQQGLVAHRHRVVAGKSR